MTPLSPVERAALLGIARGAILSHLGLAAPPALPASGPLAAPRGAFVTVRVEGELRGCLGSFHPSGSLADTVGKMAVAAAKDDPRFRPLAADELPGLELAISALEPPHELRDPRSVRIGAEGLVVTLGVHRGTLLPRVAVEHGWSAEDFLKHACLKAGLPPGAWEDPGARVEAFEAEEFGEGKNP